MVSYGTLRQVWCVRVCSVKVSYGTLRYVKVGLESRKEENNGLSMEKQFKN